MHDELLIGVGAHEKKKSGRWEKVMQLYHQKKKNGGEVTEPQ